MLGGFDRENRERRVALLADEDGVDPGRVQHWLLRMFESRWGGYHGPLVPGRQGLHEARNEPYPQIE